MNSIAVIQDGFSRIGQVLPEILSDLTPEQMRARLDPEANTIAWLVWHLARVQDDHIADASGSEQVWTSGGWAARFGLPFPDEATGYGHGPKEVALVRVDSPDLLNGYAGAVLERTGQYLAGLTEADLDRVVDERWDPPVTLGVRLVSVIVDDLQHAGQAALIRGVLRRRG